MGRDRFFVAIGNSLLPIAVGIFVTAFLIGIQDLPRGATRYPIAVIACMLLLCVIAVVREVVLVRRPGAASEHRIDLSWISERIRAEKRSVGTVLLVIVTVYLLPRIGFYLSATVFLVVLFPYLGVRRPPAVVAHVAVVVAGAYVIFDLALGVRLPVGPFGW